MKFSRYDPLYSTYPQWHDLCPEGQWRCVGPDALAGLLPDALLGKANSALVMGSAGPGSSVFVANINRVETAGSAVDQEPYIAAFYHVGSAASGGFVHHGSWPNRTTYPDINFWHAVSDSGIQAYYPLAEMPVGESGTLAELHIVSQTEAFWAALKSHRESSE